MWKNALYRNNDSHKNTGGIKIPLLMWKHFISPVKKESKLRKNGKISHCSIFLQSILTRIV